MKHHWTKIVTHHRGRECSELKRHRALALVRAGRDQAAIGEGFTLYLDDWNEKRPWTGTDIDWTGFGGEN